MAWLDRLPDAIRELQDRWLLSLGAPFDGSDVSCAWVAPAVRRGGTSAVLKLAMPHLEGVHEIEGLRFWDGDPTVHLLDADPALNAMLLERCEPGAPLRDVPEPEQDVVVARLLRRLWRRPVAPHPFRPLSTIRRFADLLEVDDGRVRLWMFARLATELDDMSPDDDVTLARALS